MSVFYKAEITANAGQAIRIARLSAVTYRITVYEVTVDEEGLQTDIARFDLTDSTLVFTVADHVAQQFQKTSAFASQIEFLAQSGATLGQATLKLIGADTEEMEVNHSYEYDVWLHTPDDEVITQVIPNRAFKVLETVNEPDTTPPDPEAGTPLFQGQQWRRFVHVWRDGQGDGDSSEVAIPGEGMLDETYHVNWTFLDLNGGPAAMLMVEEATLATDSFTLQASGEIFEGARISLELVDS